MRDPLEGADLAIKIALAPAPIVFLDTAAILDILRVPFKGLQTDIAKSALAVVDQTLMVPRGIWLVSSSNVMLEFDQNRERVRDAMADHLRLVNESVKRLLAVARGIRAERNVEEIDLLDLKMDQQIEAILKSLVDATVLFRGTEACIVKAGRRVWAQTPPSSRERQEFCDCEIFEEFLELMTAVRTHGCTERAIFVSPNTTDYGTLPNGYPPIAAALSNVGAQYAINLSHALALITRQ
jgi:hypothetical protein